MGKLFYVQDARQHVGNSMLWWAKNHEGYTCDIRKAHVFSEVEINQARFLRGTDIPWPKNYIDARVSFHIDMQHCDRSIANSEGWYPRRDGGGE
ncbi:MAG: hypothetical protein ACYS7Y_29540 [Planctomycetota bacterium]|jgi:hypothetical protein